MENKDNRRRQPAMSNPLHDRMRQLWMEHVFWTRSFIISTAADLADLDVVTRRLMRNPSDFADTLRRFYGTAKANAFRKLLEDHLSIGAALVNAAKAGDNAEADKQRNLWYRNAEEIANFMASINPHFRAGVWRNMLFDHLRLTEDEAAKRLGGQYAADVAIFDTIQIQANRMADMMSGGIARQFER